MQSTSVFLDITKVADFRWKNADVSNTYRVRHVIYVFLGFSLGMVQPYQVSSLLNMSERFRKEGSFCPPIREQPQKDPSRKELRKADSKISKTNKYESNN